MGRKKNEKVERINFKREIGELRKELKTRETTAITQILKNADVILSTNTGQCPRLKKSRSNSDALHHYCYGNFFTFLIGTCPRLQVHVMTGL